MCRISGLQHLYKNLIWALAVRFEYCGQLLVAGRQKGKGVNVGVGALDLELRVSGCGAHGLVGT
jgi:hypothetical protein